MDIVLSPSSINLFDDSPALWVMKEFYKVRSETGIYALRGKHVEAALDAYLAGGEYEDSIDMLVELDFDSEGGDLVGFFESSLSIFSEIDDTLVSTQRRIDTDIDGVKIYGFIDYEYEDYCIDLKTTKSLPKLLKTAARKGQLPAAKKANVRQQAIYHKATGKTQKLAYVTETESYLHTVQEAEIEAALSDCSRIIQNMSFVYYMDEDERLQATVPDLKKLHYHPFVDEETFEAAKEIYHAYLQS